MHQLEKLAERIVRRSESDPSESWTAQLLNSGPEAVAKKFGEEAIEAVIEATKGDRQRLIYEAADVLYHLLVMLKSNEITLDEVMLELQRRESSSGLEEKGSRS
ncbi:MAG: phosphoribosyl-ATP diphosphatase [Aestuariivita sp.]|nr:phosphoribosyl-ATP diphosphatase [Aestuariivita sp.]MCY4203713.1 phosphoribosyl-ATP diphosphatase [Aestuariivita sp.]MCY4289091.1 phosphoribosyl-ATP diphosphatase [Aestuariivita sp.]MCY4347691.1 phosphoribosyl-ATP diphosphatase [Aestuariivita sp.]